MKVPFNCEHWLQFALLAMPAIVTLNWEGAPPRQGAQSQGPNVVGMARPLSILEERRAINRIETDPPAPQDD